MAIDGCEFIRKNRSDTVNKTGGGLVLYIWDTVKYVRKTEYEVSEIEKIWAESNYNMPNNSWYVLFIDH